MNVYIYMCEEKNMKETLPNSILFEKLRGWNEKIM